MNNIARTAAQAAILISLSALAEAQALNGSNQQFDVENFALDKDLVRPFENIGGITIGGNTQDIPAFFNNYISGFDTPQTWIEQPAPATLEALTARLLARTNSGGMGVEGLPSVYLNSDSGAAYIGFRFTGNGGDRYEIVALTGPKNAPLTLDANLNFVLLSDPTEVVTEISACSPAFSGSFIGYCFNQTTQIIWNGKSTKFFGSGIFILPEFVLTARHVVSVERLNAPRITASPTDLYISNPFDLSENLEVYDVWLSDTLDLALLQLKKPIPRSKQMQFIPFWAQASFESTERFSFASAGFGLNRFGQTPSMVRWGLLEYVRDALVEAGGFQGQAKPVEQADILSKGCKSDSGAPAFVPLSGAGNMPELALLGLFLGSTGSTSTDCTDTSRFVNLANFITQSEILKAIREMEGGDAVQELAVSTNGIFQTSQ